MLETAYNWETITQNKTIHIENSTALVILNNGDVPFTITGRIIMPGKEYRFPVDGSVSDFNEELTFSNVEGNKSAVLEYKKIKSQQKC